MKLTKRKAMVLYVEKHSGARKSIARLITWNPERSVRINSKKVGFKNGHEGWKFAKQYGLGFIKTRNRQGGERQEIDKRKVALLSRLGYSYKQIGRLFKVSGSRVGQLTKARKQK